ncbi:MAG TPA: S-layer homology domain-containing protein [Symbiobacteriaceae bacterium]|nr:S-layer homology domain-containing protein [Symbiobacteriaceae bacterium]
MKRSFGIRTLLVIAALLAVCGGLLGSTRATFASAAWTTQTSGTGETLTGVEYGGGLWVTGGNTGALLTSPDGIAWTARTAANDWTAFAHDGTRWVAVGYSGKVATSTDGTSWVVQAPGGLGNIWYDVAYGAGVFVAPEANGAQMWVSADGLTWSTVDLPGNTLNGLVYGGGRFVAVGLDGAYAVSADGSTWTTGSLNTSGVNLWEVAYGNGVYVAAGDAGSIYTSPDGLSWTARTSGTTDGLYGAAYGNGTFVVSGTGGAIVRSVDGITWSADASPASVTLQRVAFGGGLFVATGDIGTIVTYSGMSSDANLADLTVSEGTLTPVFHPAVLAYTVDVPNATTSISATATPADPAVTVSGSGAPVALNVGANTVSIVVTAQDGVTQKTYTITVNRAAALSANADLAGLSVSEGTLIPAFDPAVRNYSVAVGRRISGIQVTPTPVDAAATVAINGGAASDITLKYGSNSISIVVTAQDGTTLSTYTITVQRDRPPSSSSADPPPPPAPLPTVTISAPVALTREATFTVTGTANPGAAVSVGGTTVQAGADGDWSAVINLAEGANVITAVNGSASDSVTVTRDSTPPAISLKASALVTPAETIELSASTEEGAAVEIEGRPTLTLAVRLAMGENTFAATAVDRAGNRSRVTVQVVRVEPVPKPAQPEAPPPTPPAAAFTDTDGHWAAGSITRMVQAGVVRGYEDRTFRPEAQVSRLEFAVMAARLLRLPPSGDAVTFTDAALIPGWARAQVAAAVSAGIITGRDTGAFDPHAPVTRAEMAVILVRSLKLNGRDVTPGSASFTDGDQIAGWAVAQVLAAARYGLVTGYGDGTFRANNTATRAEAVTMLSRLLDALSR